LEVVQRNNVRNMNKIESLERRIYLINLMQDKLEQMSLKIDKLERDKNNEKKVYYTNKKKIIKVKKSRKITKKPKPTVQEEPYIYVEKTTKPKVEQNSYNRRIEESEEPIPMNPKLDLNGTVTNSPQNIYRKGMEYLNNKDYDHASALFLFIIQQFPDNDLADNSMYWTGECYYATHNYQKAIEYFNNVIKRYPMGNKLPDSILKIGLSYMKLEKNGIAKDFFKQLIKKYPWSGPTKIAKEKLNELNSGVK